MALVAASCLFLAGMLHAAVTDFRHHRVLNVTIIAMVAGYLPLAIAAGLGWTAILSSVIAAALIFFIGFAAFCAGWMGGGDVKLAAVATLWIGAGMVVPLIALAALFGGVLAGLLIVLHRWQEGKAAPLGQMPYSPGIVLAALALFSNSQWFAGP